MRASLPYPSPDAWQPQSHHGRRQSVEARPGNDGSPATDAAPYRRRDHPAGAPVPKALRPVCVLFLLTVPPAAHAGSATPTDAEAAAHATHHAVVGQAPLKRVLVDVRLPNVTLVREDGKSIPVAEALDTGQPVFVDFIYTTCTAICPVTSATFAALEDRLGAARVPASLVSISIDPEEDTPRRLTEFRRKYNAGAQWHHYTGTMEASVAVQRAFGVFTGDKMGHTPVTLVRASAGQPWVRIDGFASPDDLLHEIRANAKP
jgi:protein SCO1/2